MAQYKSWPPLLVPTLSTALNVGIAIGGYTATVGFAVPGTPGPAAAFWFDRFLIPGFVTVSSLGVFTLGSGLWASHRSKQKSESRWALLGFAFTVGHFMFGKAVIAFWERMQANPHRAQPELAGWLTMHMTRTCLTDITAFLCFLSGLLEQISP
ncbi:hypothetical protein BDV29DRAFT_186593 [Aspergillus leporis]|uniref:Integral membrane protein n=1 Tax=Aspergillus leporis TaxID=41062 RepID=A0A5N5WG58_9EURO|nr:hypothetical protein BDV29DRAFT_186593 [Aspergillus leporis]